MWIVRVALKRPYTFVVWLSDFDPWNALDLSHPDRHLSKHRHSRREHHLELYGALTNGDVHRIITLQSVT